MCTRGSAVTVNNPSIWYISCYYSYEYSFLFFPLLLSSLCRRVVVSSSSFLRSLPRESRSPPPCFSPRLPGILPCHLGLYRRVYSWKKPCNIPREERIGRDGQAGGIKLSFLWLPCPRGPFSIHGVDSERCFCCFFSFFLPSASERKDPSTLSSVQDAPRTLQQQATRAVHALSLIFMIQCCLPPAAEIKHYSAANHARGR